MPILHIALVALIQGITEFLPISSSGHLILLPNLTGLPDQGQAIDVAVHVGTLGAVVVYFRQDVQRALKGLPKVARRQIDDQNAWLALCLIIATIPVVLIGLVMQLSGIEQSLRSLEVVGWTTLIFGLVLWWADRTGTHDREFEGWSLKHAWYVGLWQAIALIPGTSRSGITITGARFLGYKRHDAARIAMLMSIPAIAASGIFLMIEVASQANAAAARDGALAAAMAFLAAIGALHFMMRLLRTVSFTPYVIVRVSRGIARLAVAYG